jgi:hypothetical protein
VPHEAHVLLEDLKQRKNQAIAQHVSLWLFPNIVYN